MRGWLVNFHQTSYLQAVRLPVLWYFQQRDHPQRRHPCLLSEFPFLVKGKQFLLPCVFCNLTRFYNKVQQTREKALTEFLKSFLPSKYAVLVSFLGHFSYRWLPQQEVCLLLNMVLVVLFLWQANQHPNHLPMLSLEIHSFFRPIRYCLK